MAVKGKRDAEKIYTARRALSGREKQAWTMHNAAMEEYFPNQNFDTALRLFEQVQKLAARRLPERDDDRALPDVPRSSPGARLAGLRGDEEEMSAA